MTDLKTELTEIRGVGDATAETILEVLEAHSGSENDDEVLANVREALDYLDAGRPGYARKYLLRVLE